MELLQVKEELKQKEAEKQAEEKLEALKKVIKSMRQTECFGITQNEVDLQWSKENDLQQMLLNVQIKIKELKYNISGTRFGAF